MLTARVSPVICKEPLPVFVMVSTLVTETRGVGIVNVRVRTPATVDNVPLVARVKVNAPVPRAIPVPVSVTGLLVTVAPV
jgi:hypothetical protein